MGIAAADMGIAAADNAAEDIVAEDTAADCYKRLT